MIPPVTVAQLEQIMPRAHEKLLAEYAPYLFAAMSEAQIDTPERAAAFLAQLAHESNELTHWVEESSGEQYEGRADLGNTQPGDGHRYRGRGPIQLTGRANYRDAGRALGIDLEGHPERAYWIDTGFRIAAWFWARHKCNAIVDLDGPAMIERVTRCVNGGLNGIESREAYYTAACAALGVRHDPLVA